MANVGLDFPITADPAQAEAEVKRFRAFVKSEFAGVSSDVKSSATSFNALRQAINQNAETTRGALSRALLEGRKNIGGLISEAKAAQKEFDAVEKAVERALKLATGSGGLFSSIKSGLSSGIAQTALGLFGGNLLTGALSKLGSGLKDEVMTGFDFLDLQKRSKIAFTTIFRNAGHSAEEAADMATKHLQELVDFGAKTPFRTSQLIELSQQLQAVGFKSKEVVPMLTAIGDAVAGMGGDPEKMQRIITQLGQIKTTAKVSGEDLRVLAEAGVPAWRYLAEYAGKSVAEVQKLAQKNQLDAGAAVKVITAGMEHDFQGMMKATEGTYSSMWSTIEDLNQQRAAQAFKPAFDKVKEGQAAAIMGLQSGAAEGFAKGAADAQKVVLGGFDKMLSGIATGDFKRLGFGALESVVTGAKEGAKGLYDAGANAGAQLEQGWRDRMEQHSPSAVMEGLGFDAGASLLFGFLKGVQSKEILDRIEKAIQEAAKKFQLDPDLIRAAIKKESHFNPRAVSNKGAMGLTQLMPGTAERYGVKDPFNIEQNIMGGAHYLADLFKMFHEDVRLALAAYNAGEGRGIMKTPEARLNRLIETNKSGVGDYVDTIMRFFTRYQTGVDAPSAQSAAPRVAPPELAALTKERGQLNAETLDHIEALQLEQQRMARLSASLAKDMGKGPFSEAANSDLVKRREELEAAMNRNAQEMETYFLTQTKALNELDAKIAALKSRAASMPDSRDMGLAVDLPTGRAFDASQYLKPAIADAGKLTAGIHDATTSQYELLKAIAATGDAAEKGYGAAGQKVKALGDLINETQQGPVSGVDRYAKPTVTEDEEGDEVTTKATAGQQAAAGLHSALKDVQQMSKAAFGDFAQGIGSTVQQFVLLGSTGPHALRKVTAQTLASLSAEATVKALMALADGFVHLFTNPPQAAADFTAAAIYGGIAGVSAIAGRAVAGDIFKNEQQGEGAGASDGAGGSSDRTIREGRTGGASDPYVIERSRNAPAPQPIIIHLEAQAVTKNEPGTLTEHVLNIVSNDPRAQVAVVDHVERDLKMVDGRMQNAVTRGIRDMYQNRDDKITYVLEHAASRF